MSGSPIAPAPAEVAANDQVYVGRQPVFDRNRKTVAYQLLHRSSTINNADPSMNGNATRELVEHSLLQWGLDQLLGGVPGHIRVDADFLASGLHLTLPPDRVALEFADDVDIDGAHKFAVIDAKLAGFTILLSDALGRDSMPRHDLIRLADVMKVDVSATSAEALPAAIADLRSLAPSARMMAVRVEEIQQFQLCLDLGFDLFQGFFFAKPEVLSRKGRSVTSTAAIALLVEVQRPNVSLKRLEELVIADPTLAYRLLALVNSSAVGLSTRVESVYHALVLLGVERVRQMATLITMANRSKGNEEVLLLAATRAHMARALIDVPEMENAAYTAGLLSVIDVLFRVAMEELVTELPLAPVVAEALTHGSGPIGELLQALEAYERVDLARLEALRPGELARFITVYREGAVAAQVLRAQLTGG
jgi:EAL and modified HD-GYP domain-containing signal transduction protein